MAEVYLSLGTNLGSRLENLESAVQALAPEVRVLKLSPVYLTAPWGYTDQPDFLNQVVKGETGLAPEELLAFLKSLEAALGREPTFRYGPRLIDVDLLFYDDLILETTGLVIPHPRLHERPFVLVPLADLAPDLKHPAMGKTIIDLLTAVDISDVRRFEN
jgi:2-amino-4-hydroxy-6-hydroxymethyldihydropteridine diphosphokinase